LAAQDILGGESDTMNKIISTLAIAGMGAGLAVGAHAQTVLGSSTGLYALSVTAPVVTAGPSAGLYEYSYTATLTAASAGLNVSSFTIGSIAGYDGVSSVTNPGLTDFAVSPTATPGSADFTAASGFSFVGDTATFTVESTDPVATGTVGLTSNGTGTAPVASSTTDEGPGPATTAVPEAGSFALLGLGLLPLGLLARRRMANNA
jgi:hypothetical protein